MMPFLLILLAKVNIAFKKNNFFNILINKTHEKTKYK